MSQLSGEAIRIAVLTPRLPPGAGMGGIAAAHFNLFSALSDAGWQVRAFAYQDSQDSESATEVRRVPSRGLVAGIKAACHAALAILDPSRQSFQLAEALNGAIAALRIRKPLARFQPSIVIVPDKGCPLAFIPKPPGSRIVWMSHNNPMRFLDVDASPALSALDARLAVRVEALALKKADLVLCPSRDMREQFRKTYRFDGPIEIVPNLISGEVAAAGRVAPPLREILRISESAPLFFLPAAGTGVKGGRFLAPLLAEIGRRHAEAGVYVSGHLEHAYAGAPAGAPANVRVFCPGALPYREHLARVRECDVALSCALLEGFGMSLLEAGWLGVPAAAFAVGGIPEIIGGTDGGANGETVPVGDIGRLCDAGDALVRRLRSGELTRARVADYTRTRFSTAQTVARLGVLFQELCDKAIQTPAR